MSPKAIFENFIPEELHKIMAMRNIAFRLINNTPASLRALVLRPWYEYISQLDRDGDVLFMNYGYSDPLQSTPSLRPADEPNRYSIQLYEKLVSQLALENHDVLEIGSGRGGGAAYLASYHNPRSYIGVDLTRRAVQFAQQRHSHPALTFQRGNAESLGFSDESFDIVINLESSHCYPNFDEFIKECWRLLRPGGMLAFADWRKTADLPAIEQRLKQTGFTVINYEDISQGILSAIDKDHARKAELIERHAPALLRSAFSEFSGLRNSRAFDQAFRNGDRIYFRYLLQKP